LKQRNQYLKQLAEKKQTDPLYLDILTEQLVTFGSKILWTRINFVKKLEYWANQLHQLISQEKETLTLHYDATVAFEEANLADIEVAYNQAFAAIRAKELFRQMTLIGPHRDELVFFINGKNVQTYGSQGQQRTTALRRRND